MRKLCPPAALLPPRQNGAPGATNSTPATISSYGRQRQNLMSNRQVAFAINIDKLACQIRMMQPFRTIPIQHQCHFCRCKLIVTIFTFTSTQGCKIVPVCHIQLPADCSERLDRRSQPVTSANTNKRCANKTREPPVFY